MSLTASKILGFRPMFHRRATGEETSWELPLEVLEFIEERSGPGMYTLETGAGVSTVLFAARGCRHTTIVPDRDQVGRIQSFCRDYGVSLDSVRFVVAASQDALPSYDGDQVDLALIDGSHSFPVAFFDLFYIIRKVKAGGILIIDNTNIWSGHVIKKFLLHESEWSLEKDFPISVAFRKLSEHDLDKDWINQPYVLNASYKYLLEGKLRRVAWLIKNGDIILMFKKLFALRWLRLY
jgi:hypothetical protein